MAREGVDRAIDQIPPDAWPVIDIMTRVLIGLTVAWIILALIAWWRRRAYNLTVASTAKRRKKAQPDFLSVDEKARKKAIERGDDYEDQLAKREREEARAALAATKEPVTIATRVARLATLLMSVFTLLTGFSGAILNVTRMGEYLEEASAWERIEYLFTEYTLGFVVAIFVISYNIWRYIAEKQWEKA